ncbi:hypothetical protein AK812_SmicGene30889 [Symbiodinium microadriaticum]|uniref:Uncharacterized protein n=1 Tax=Symbiodinium microadriaticum TaxID=2951 RepID=A0A1Q9CY45_SYMMI|nr:hypothetical protein AK812_SmicGene30889 [Symbiodinium microadriaticum]
MFHRPRDIEMLLVWFSLDQVSDDALHGVWVELDHKEPEDVDAGDDDYDLGELAGDSAVSAVVGFSIRTQRTAVLRGGDDSYSLIMMMMMMMMLMVKMMMMITMVMIVMVMVVVTVMMIVLMM